MYSSSSISKLEAAPEAPPSQISRVDAIVDGNNSHEDFQRVVEVGLNDFRASPNALAQTTERVVFMLIYEPRRVGALERWSVGADAASGHVLMPRLLTCITRDAIRRSNESLSARNKGKETHPGESAYESP